jgi:hypothetical protein
MQDTKSCECVVSLALVAACAQIFMISFCRWGNLHFLKFRFVGGEVYVFLNFVSYISVICPNCTFITPLTLNHQKCDQSLFCIIFVIVLYHICEGVAPGLV